MQTILSNLLQVYLKYRLQAKLDKKQAKKQAKLDKKQAKLAKKGRVDE